MTDFDPVWRIPIDERPGENVEESWKLKK